MKNITLINTEKRETPENPELLGYLKITILKIYTDYYGEEQKSPFAAAMARVQLSDGKTEITMLAMDDLYVDIDNGFLVEA